MQPDKKQLEILIMQYFRNIYDEFPQGKVVPSESPDFTISMKNHHVLGIELTRLNPGNAIPLDEKHLNEIKFMERLIGLAKELFEKDVPHKLFVKFLFSEKNSIGSEKELITAVQIANIIREAVKNKRRESFFKLFFSGVQLPDGLDEMLIVNHPELQISIWERSNNLGISNDVLDDIRQSIHKKDEKLRLYQKQRLNYYWLLITTDRLRGVRSFNLPDKILNHKFHSQFQHVFLFDLIKADVITLV